MNQETKANSSRSQLEEKRSGTMTDLLARTSRVGKLNELLIDGALVNE